MDKEVFANRKKLIGTRVPPGDNWRCVHPDNPEPGRIFRSLTELYNHVFNFTGKSEFLLSARENSAYIFDSEKLEGVIVANKNYSLYGEE